MRTPAARNATLIGLALLARACRALDRPAELARLKFPPRGKPHWEEGPDFSIAHCAGRVACAVASVGRVGLDLERRGAARAEHLRLALQALELAALAERGRSPTDGFVMKEAAVKAAGGTVADVARVQLEDGGARFAGDDFALNVIDVGADFIAWLATDVAPLVTVVRCAAAELAPGDFARAAES